MSTLPTPSTTGRRAWRRQTAPHAVPRSRVDTSGAVANSGTIGIASWAPTSPDRAPATTPTSTAGQLGGHRHRPDRPRRDAAHPQRREVAGAQPPAADRAHDQDQQRDQQRHGADQAGQLQAPRGRRLVVAAAGLGQRPGGRSPRCLLGQRGGDLGVEPRSSSANHTSFSAPCGTSPRSRVSRWARRCPAARPGPVQVADPRRGWLSPSSPTTGTVRRRRVGGQGRDDQGRARRRAASPAEGQHRSGPLAVDRDGELVGRGRRGRDRPGAAVVVRRPPVRRAEPTGRRPAPPTRLRSVTGRRSSRRAGWRARSRDGQPVAQRTVGARTAGAARAAELAERRVQGLAAAS